VITARHHAREDERTVNCPRETYLDNSFPRLFSYLG
jgi:hypothetical protein